MLAAVTGTLLTAAAETIRRADARQDRHDPVEMLLARQLRRRRAIELMGVDPYKHNHTLYMMPIWEDGLDPAGVTDGVYEQQISKLKNQCGRGNRYNRLGFSSIYNTGNLPLLSRQLRIFKTRGIHRGVILPVQTHDQGLVNPNGDLRNYQWRLDGRTWRGIPGRTDGRDTLVVTPSRYAVAVRREMKQRVHRWAAEIIAAMRQFAGVIRVINFCIEEELAIGGTVSDAYLADYSPFAIAEFRDFLRHQGLYHPDGAFAGQGAGEAIVGKFIEVNGRRTSPFHLDPSPARAAGNHASFNETFGVNFRTWSLAYWDIEKFPHRVTDVHFNPSPVSGTGAIVGGFDAPRVRNSGKWWRAWDWTYQGHHDQYPPGNPENPAYGFREVMVANFVRDIADELIAAGLPQDFIYPHQIPAEMLGASPAGARRALSSASTIWSGYLPRNGHLGITRFGDLNPRMVNQYSRNWGIFEWHPAPALPPESPELYRLAMAELRKCTAGGCHIFFPGWWMAPVHGKYQDKNTRRIFPLNDSNFARAINDFLKSRPDSPHWL